MSDQPPTHTTPSTSPDAHPSIDTLADRAEGLLGPVLDREVADHLAGCATCQTMVSRLAEVSGLLARAVAQVGEPGPMPAAVAEQVTLALRAEAAQRPVREPVRVAIEDADHSTRVSRIRRLAERWRSGWRWDRALLAAAAVASVALVAPQLVEIRGGGDSAASGGMSTDAAGGGTAAEAPPESAQDMNQATDAELRRLAEEIAASAGFRGEGPPKTTAGRDEHRLAADCGAVLAGDLGDTLVGAAPSSGLVLVVTRSPEIFTFHLIPTCDSPAEAVISGGALGAP